VLLGRGRGPLTVMAATQKRVILTNLAQPRRFKVNKYKIPQSTRRVKNDSYAGCYQKSSLSYKTALEIAFAMEGTKAAEAAM